MKKVKLYQTWLMALILFSLCSPTVFAKEATVDLRFIDNVLNQLSSRLAQYPPRFSDELDRKKTTEALQAMTQILDNAAAQFPNDKEILYRDAYVNGLGHNLDFPNATQKAREQYKKALMLVPDSPVINYQYGLFLSQTQAYNKESIPFLQKAAKLGIQNAYTTLAGVYLMQQDQASALIALKKYAQTNPNNKQVNELISGIENHTLKVNVVNVPTQKQ